MQTGYDSFWMYQNSRQEPVLNFPKNDNYSHAVLTDSYKQVQNGGHPSHLNSNIRPRNNVARSHLEDQNRVSGSEYIWPSSVYSLPSKSSHVSNLNPQQAFSTQSNTIGYSSQYSQAQQNFRDVSDLRNLKNTNANFPQMYNNSGKSVHTGGYQNGNTQTPRIRVRDVFSLNKSTIYNDVSTRSSYQTYQKEQHGYALNFSAAAQNIVCNSNGQNEFVNFGKSNLSQSNHPVSYYHPTSTEQSHQFLHNSNSLYQQNPDSQLQYATSGPVDRNVNLEPSVTNTCNNRLGNLLNLVNNQDQNTQNVRGGAAESLQGSKRVKIIPKRNLVQKNDSEVKNNSGFPDSVDGNRRLIYESSSRGSANQIQKQGTQVNKNSTFRGNSSTDAASKGLSTSTARSAAYQHNSGLENTVIKISIPHSGQNTYLTLNNEGAVNSTNETSSLSLPCLLEANDEYFAPAKNNNNTRTSCIVNMSAPQAVETSSCNPKAPSSIHQVSHTSPAPAEICTNPESYRNNLTVPPRKRFCHLKEPFLNLNKENLDEFLNSTENSRTRSGNFGSRRDCENLARETIFQNDITMNALKLKHENFGARGESAASVCNPSKGKVVLEIIKTEKTPADEMAEFSAEEDESPALEESNTGEEHLSSVIEFTENTVYSKIDVKEFTFPCEVQTLKPDARANDSENCIDRGNNNSNDKTKDSTIGKGLEMFVPGETAYKSKINRDKLDKLIQFLEKDEDPVRGKSRPAVKKNDLNEMDLNHNRRKLSKTCIVKNKNNSREMISMISHKVARVDLSRCSSETPQIVKGNANSDKMKETKTAGEDKSKFDENVNSLEKDGDPVRESQTQEEDSESKNTNDFSTEEFEQVSHRYSSKTNCPQEEESVINTIRALQTLKSILCRSCDLVSSLDLFWVNLASGELRCLNCFKKATSTSEEHTFKTKTNDGSMKSAQTENENKRENTFERRSENLKECIKQETIEPGEVPKKAQMEKEKETPVSPKTPRRRSSSTEVTPSEKRKIVEEQKRMIKKEEQPTKTHILKEVSVRLKHLEDSSKPEVKDGKSKRKDNLSAGKLPPKVAPFLGNSKRDQLWDQSLRKNTPKDHQGASKAQDALRRSISMEEDIAEEHTKREKKGPDCSSQNKNRRDSKDFAKAPEDHGKKETKMDPSEKSIKKTTHTFHKDMSEQMRKSAKHEQVEKAENPSPSKESSASHKPKTSEQIKLSDELKIRNILVDKHKKTEYVGQTRKRKNSDEDVSATKLRIMEDHIKKDVKTVPQKTNSTKEDSTKYKNKMENETKYSAEKPRRSSLTKEEGEHSKKETKQSYDSSKVKEVVRVDVNQKTKPHEHTKVKTSDAAVTSRRKSKEEQVVQKRHESKETTDMQRRKSTSKEDVLGSPRLQELLRTKHGAENNDRKKSEEKEKNHSSGKISKPSERVVTSAEQPRKSDTTSRPLKENQNTKSENWKLKTNDSHKKEQNKNGEDKKDEKKCPKTAEANARTQNDTSSNKKNISDRWEGKCDKSQTENRHSKSSVECYFRGQIQNGALTEIKGEKHSATLLAKLIKKTKKLSWSLLGET